MNALQPAGHVLYKNRLLVNTFAVVTVNYRHCVVWCNQPLQLKCSKLIITISVRNLTSAKCTTHNCLLCMNCRHVASSEGGGESIWNLCLRDMVQYPVYQSVSVSLSPYTATIRHRPAVMTSCCAADSDCSILHSCCSCPLLVNRPFTVAENCPKLPGWCHSLQMHQQLASIGKH